MPKVYGYARLSHADKFDKDSIPAQRDRIRAYYDFNLKNSAEWVGVFDDAKATSASKVAFENRVAGQKLLNLLEPGDHIVFDKVDRVWRSMKDFVGLMEIFRSRNINVHFCDFRGASITLGTPMGDFFLTMIVAIAELESKTTGARIKEAMKRKSMKCGGTLSTMRWFCDSTYIEEKERWHSEWNETKYAVIMKVHALDEDGYSREEIIRKIQAEESWYPWKKDALMHTKKMILIYNLFMYRYILQEKIVDPNKSPFGNMRARRCKTDAFRYELYYPNAKSVKSGV